MAKRPGFHTPFSGAMGRLLDEQRKRDAESRSAAAQALEKKRELERAKTAAKSGAPSSASSLRSNQSDSDLFAEAMGGVRPIEHRGERIAARAEPPKERSPVSRAFRRASDDAETDAQLADLVSGGGAFQWTEEPLEGLAFGCDKRLLRRLKQGAYVHEQRIDLHGLDRAAAKEQVHKLIHTAKRNGFRTVLVIHGQGFGSEGGVPILKPALGEWLTKPPFARDVLAFAPASPADGGQGATLILLRRQGRTGSDAAGSGI